MGWLSRCGFGHRGPSVSARRIAPRICPAKRGEPVCCEILEGRALLAGPVVTGMSPVDLGIGVGVGAKVSVTFNEPMERATISKSTLQLQGPSGAVSARISYNPVNNTATLDAAAPLQYGATYTATVFGGSSGVKDTSGEGLAADVRWSFATAPSPTSGPGGPILIVTSAANPFGGYYPEILRAEGLNEFAAVDISTVSSTLLALYDVAILAEMALDSEQADVFSNWVSSGGRLIAMRPDKRLADLLGLADAGGMLSNAYLLVDGSSGPGVGITDQTMQFHGDADEYTLNGATSIATLYSTATSGTWFPAVTIRNVGSNGGQAAAFTYDLARSVVYTRQGNPAWAAQERDGLTPIRSDDLFYGGSQADWVDFSKIAIPQADEHQRLLTNLVGQMEADRMPLPRFWYLPWGLKAAVLMTGDDHALGGTSGRFKTYVASSPAGGSVADWGAIRGSSYVYPNSPLTDAQAAQYAADGFEVAAHVTTLRNNYTSFNELDAYYASQLRQYNNLYPSLPTPSTHRTHATVWSDYDTQARVELSHRIRLDVNYYYWPQPWVQNRPGLFTGSGMPMRFAGAGGDVIDVYQATTQMTDESGQSYPLTINTLLDNAVGPLGYYGVFTANMHTDAVYSAGSDAIIAAAQIHGVPVVTAEQVLQWLDGRNGSFYRGLKWDGASGVLSFGIRTAIGADGLQGMVPVRSGNGAIAAITRNGAAVAYTTQVVKGVEYAFFAGVDGEYVASYASGTAPAVISGGEATADAFGRPTIGWGTDRVANSRVDYGTSPDGLTLSASDPTGRTDHRVGLTGLVANSTYFYRVSSTDAAGNTSTWPASSEPPASVVVGSVPSTVITGTEGNDAVYIVRSGQSVFIILRSAGLSVQTASIPLASLTSLAFAGGGGDDSVIIDFANGNPDPSGGFAFDGDAGSDSVTVLGTIAGSYAPSGTKPDSGLLTIGTARIAFSGTEWITVNGLSELTVVTANADDALTIDSTAIKENRLGGVSGGTVLPSLSFYNVSTLALNIAANDAGAGNDTITIAAPGLIASELRLLKVNAGTGSNSLSVGTSITNLDTNLGVGGGNLTVNANGAAIVSLIGSPSLAGLNVSGTASVSLEGLGEKLLRVGSLSIGPNATVDLGNSDMIVTASESDREGVLAAVSIAIRRGRANNWSGTGLRSSTAATDTRGMTGLGAIINDKGGSVKVRDVFDGVAVDANAVLVKFTWNGDTNFDGMISADDYFTIDSGYITQKGGWYNGDLTYDNVVNADDYFLVDSAFIGQIGPLAVEEDIVVVQREQREDDQSPTVLEQLFSVEPVV